MTHVPYTINVPEYVCGELDRQRTMLTTMDFSGLRASIERVQYHVTSMENALGVYSDTRHELIKILEDESTAPEERIKQALERVKLPKRFSAEWRFG